MLDAFRGKGPQTLIVGPLVGLGGIRDYLLNITNSCVSDWSKCYNINIFFFIQFLPFVTYMISYTERKQMLGLPGLSMCGYSF